MLESPRGAATGIQKSWKPRTTRIEAEVEQLVLVAREAWLRTEAAVLGRLRQEAAVEGLDSASTSYLVQRMRY